MVPTGISEDFEMQSGSTMLRDWPLLEWHRVFHGRDVEEARAFFSRMAIRFDVKARDAMQLDACVSGIYLPDIYIGCARYGAPAAWVASPARNDYWVHLPLQGMWQATVGRGSLVCQARDAVVSSPTREVILHSDTGAARLSLSLTSDSLKRRLALLLGEPPVEPLEFVPTMNPSRGYGCRLAHMLTAAVNEFKRGRVVRWSARTMVDFAETIVSTLLLYHPHNYSAVLRRSERTIAPRDIKRAVDYIESRVDSPLTIADLVAASQVRGRTLFQHFRDYKGTSPIRYLRNARFAKVRDALLRAEPEESVTSIAMACGFTHMSRFAVEYRHRFGERPSDTLRRDRRRRENARGGVIVVPREKANDASVAALAQGRHHGHRERAAAEVRGRLLNSRTEAIALQPD
jgi:AraC-like DNA-binding protein